MLVVAAHPDDETIGIGATLGALAASGVSVRVLHVTDGAPRDPALRPALRERSVAESSRVRRDEVRAALAAGGLPPAALEPTLGFPDQGVAAALVEVTLAVRDRLAARTPDVVVTHPYEGGHPDHDAAAFAVHAAVALLARASGPEPAVVEMTSYHAVGDALVTGEFLSAPVRHAGCAVRAGWLDGAGRARKRRMLRAFASQAEVLRPFGDTREPLRCAPIYDFERPPHEGTLAYERQPFGWTGERFRLHARAASLELGLGRAR